MAAYCAADQNKFWEMHDALFTNNRDVEEQGSFAPRRLQQIAEGLGLDMAAFNSCISTGKYKDQVDQDFADAQAAGINGTPFYVITYTVNGETKTDTIEGAQPFAIFQQKLDAALAAAGANRTSWDIKGRRIKSASFLFSRGLPGSYFPKSDSTHTISGATARPAGNCPPGSLDLQQAADREPTRITPPAAVISFIIGCGDDRVQLGRQQADPALVNQDYQGSRTIRRRPGWTQMPARRSRPGYGFDRQQAVIAAQAVLDGAQDRQRADAEQQRSGQESAHEFAGRASAGLGVLVKRRSRICPSAWKSILNPCHHSPSNAPIKRRPAQ